MRRSSSRAPADGSLKFDQTTLTAKAGKVTIDFANPLQRPHGVEIEGNGVEEKTETVTSGDAPPITVDLKPGTYEFYCPVRRPQGGRHEGHAHREVMRRATSWWRKAKIAARSRRTSRRVRDLAERPVRQRVADGVAHQRPAAGPSGANSCVWCQSA